ncbi:B-box zinc finger family protein 24 [Tanacetum coccineum]|uniref:B-box zinc finger family protein 24 n=1 Tax=Tanacetum coccineum TaxID=301880 RepID=A0ABQ4XWV3_9ASTR
MSSFKLQSACLFANLHQDVTATKGNEFEDYFLGDFDTHDDGFMTYIDGMIIKYFLPGNKKNLITVSKDKEFQRMVNYYKEADRLEEKTASIFCVKDIALFCRDCDEPLHSAGSLAANDHHFLATRIRVVLTSSSTQVPEKNQHDHPSPPATENNVAAVVPQVVRGLPYNRYAWLMTDNASTTMGHRSDTGGVLFC